jgi:hypothetical protein
MNSRPDKALSDGLKNLCAASDAARKLMESFTSRTKDARETTVERAAWLAGADYGEMLAAFRQLDALGAGRFIPGRHGYKSRMEWNFSIRSLGQVAQGQKNRPDQVSDDAIIEDGTEEGASSDLKMIQHDFQLREGVKIQFMLPADISEKEAERLAKFVQALPF